MPRGAGALPAASRSRAPPTMPCVSIRSRCMPTRPQPSPSLGPQSRCFASLRSLLGPSVLLRRPTKLPDAVLLRCRSLRCEATARLGYVLLLLFAAWHVGAFLRSSLALQRAAMLHASRCLPSPFSCFALQCAAMPTRGRAMSCGRVGMRGWAIAGLSASMGSNATAGHDAGMHRPCLATARGAPGPEA